ncbi:hypothetical protein Mx8p40 [Myxococcus phage Mx8]|uniref:p40 n=1 Tax=Myxococcus phage Mx8 TaxID=49964 RepID=Q94MS9_9CAUD|nr:hypothetical protein Mx8p40 [Myxococcus phage Mx8]AAK94375.1 p40 [Myxococcus phage Mx8]
MTPHIHRPPRCRLCGRPLGQCWCPQAPFAGRE